MITIDLSKKELETLIAGLREREDRMYKDSVLYRDQDNAGFGTIVAIIRV